MTVAMCLLLIFDEPVVSGYLDKAICRRHSGLVHLLDQIFVSSFRNMVGGHLAAPVSPRVLLLIPACPANNYEQGTTFATDR